MKRRLEKLCVYVIQCEENVLLTLFDNHIFHLATEKIISRKLISDPDMYQSIKKFNISGPPGQLSGNFVV